LPRIKLGFQKWPCLEGLGFLEEDWKAFFQFIHQKKLLGEGGNSAPHLNFLIPFYTPKLPLPNGEGGPIGRLLEVLGELLGTFLLKGGPLLDPPF